MWRARHTRAATTIEQDRFIVANIGDSRVYAIEERLTSYVPDPDIAAVLRSQQGADAVTSLIELALAAGGHDNLTVALIET